VEALVIIIEGTCVVWLLHSNVLAVHGPQIVVGDLALNFSANFRSGAAKHFVFVDLNDGFAHLW